jgi:uncharacterized protein GlcG (DUF336 family)
MLKRVLIAGASLALLSSNALADTVADPQQSCSLPSYVIEKVQKQLKTVVTQNNGSVFAPSPSMMWSAIVDRKGVVCSVISTRDNDLKSDPWPGSRDIAMAKAFTANGFSNNKLAISTANLYAPTQPGGPLYGLNNSNPFNPEFNRQGTGINHVAGGIITFGGGVALYENGQVIGGLGVSGDTSCADHAIAYRMRKAAGFDKIPGGPNSSGTDNIEYATSGVAPTGFQQPHCLGANDVTP